MLANSGMGEWFLPFFSVRIFGIFSGCIAFIFLLLSHQPEEFFASQMEAIGRVKHKTLVTSLGYCTEGPYRMLVSEYVDNGNLHHWLRDFPSLVNTLTWNMRLNIISGVARGLAYLHEEVEPKIIHGSIKSSNVLLDHQWSPKISDFDLAKLLGPDWSHVIMEALGYVAPDCHSSSTLTEGMQGPISPGTCDGWHKLIKASRDL